MSTCPPGPYFLMIFNDMDYHPHYLDSAVFCPPNTSLPLIHFPMGGGSLEQGHKQPVTHKIIPHRKAQGRHQCSLRLPHFSVPLIIYSSLQSFNHEHYTQTLYPAQTSSFVDIWPCLTHHLWTYPELKLGQPLISIISKSTLVTNDTFSDLIQ